MHYNKYLRLLISLSFLISTQLTSAQDLSLRNFNDEARLVDRYEILSGELSQFFYGTHKNVSAKAAISMLTKLNDISLSKTDKHNIKTIIGTNFASIPNTNSIEQSKKSILKTFYNEPHNMFSYAATDGSFMVSINPIIQYTQLKENNNAQSLFINQKGLDISASILNKIKIYTLLTDNQERGPSYFSDFSKSIERPAGTGFMKPFNRTSGPNISNGYDYTLAKGYVSADIIPNVINASFGHDKFFIGDGQRSLFLSDFGTNMLFLKTNWHFWRIYYQTTLMELTSTKAKGVDGLLPKKYGAMHHLGLAINKKLNVGLFEAVMFGRQDHFEFQYLNPLIFYRTVEQQLGSPDNALLGIDAKYLPAKNMQVYGQLLLDEFRFGDILSGNKSWANKQAYQLGIKYINAFGIKNLDIQVEHNNIRPYTYSYKDSIADYSSYNQALAHPNGANLREQLLVIHYQPIPKLQINVESIFRKQGMDSSLNYSFGGNILKTYLLHGADNGHENLSGVLQKTFFTNVNASYQLLQNIYVDAGVLYRTNSLGAAIANPSTTIYLCARLNSARRKYNY
jgi:hypothetical protein